MPREGKLQQYVPMMGSKLLGPKSAKKGLKAHDSRVFASTIQQPRNTDLGRKSLTSTPDRMYMLPKRLRAGT